MPKTLPICLTILGKDYRVACREEEAEPLQAAATYLDEKMQAIRTSGRVIGIERVAVMAALNISHELLSATADEPQQHTTLIHHIHVLKEKIEGQLQLPSMLPAKTDPENP